MVHCFLINSIPSLSILVLTRPCPSLPAPTRCRRTSRGRLEAEGIAAWIADEHTALNDWTLRQALE